MATRMYETPGPIARYGEKVPVHTLLQGEGGVYSTSTDALDLRKALEHRHEEYMKYERSWEREDDCYEGDYETMFKYLHKHEREHGKSYTARIARAAYINYCEPVVDLFVSYIYRRPVVRKPLGDLTLPASLAMLRQIKLQQQHDEQQRLGPQPAEMPQPQPGQPPQQMAQQAAMAQQQQRPPAQPSPVEQTAIAPEGQSDLTPEVAAYSLAMFAAKGGPQVLAIYNDLYKDADLRGSRLDEFMRSVARDAQATGYVGVLVDAPTAETAPRTEAERKSRGQRPYLVKIRPEDIVDWELDDKGKFEWVRIKEDTAEPRGPFDAGVDKVTIYYTWTKSSWHKHKVPQRGKGDVELVDEGENPLGEVPLIVAYNKKKKRCSLVGDSAIDDISLLNIAIFNWWSMLDEEVYQKCLSILTMKATLDEDKEIELGSKNVLEYPEEKPAFIAPMTEPWGFMIEMIKLAVEEIYRIARMGGGGSGIKISEAESGVAHAYKFSETNQALSDKAQMLEKAEIEIHRLYGLWYDREFEGQITYPDEFGVEDLIQELNFLVQSRSAFTSITALRELEKRVAKKLLQDNVDEKTMQRIMAEIDSNTREDYKAPGEFVLPGANKPPAAPGAEATLPFLTGDDEVDALAQQLLARMGSRNASRIEGVPKGIPTTPAPEDR